MRQAHHLAQISDKDNGNFPDITAVLNRLEQRRIRYAVLRNYERLLDEEMYLDGHGDIDLLCSDSEALAAALGAFPHEFHAKNGQADGVHYYIYVGENYVSLDLRSIGDGYYCARWQEDMLARRRKYNGFYVLSEEDYFYSLIYHAVFQKRKFSDDYRSRLTDMGTALGLEMRDTSAKGFVGLLESFMKKHDYRYQYPKDKYVPLKTKYIEARSLLDVHFPDYWRHLVFGLRVGIIEFLVKVKHTFRGSR